MILKDSLPNQSPSKIALKPNFLGSLYNDGRELHTSNHTLFPGDEKTLGKREVNNRINLINCVAPRLNKVLNQNETVLYIAPALEYPSLFDQLGFGAWWPHFFQVALIFTDQRMIEILLTKKLLKGGQYLDTRTRSFPFKQIRELLVKGKKVTIQTPDGEKQKWRLIGKDKEILRLIVTKIKENNMGISTPSIDSVPLWHCPDCGNSISENPDSCSNCQTPFRTKKWATNLSLLFPGAGLYYSGHPVLGTFDFLGEIYFFFLTIILALSYQPGNQGSLISLLLIPFLLILTKVESVHLSRVLTHRTKPITSSRLPFWKRFHLVGGIISSLAVVSIIGSLGLAQFGKSPAFFKRSVIADLEFQVPLESWEVKRIGDPSENLGQIYGKEIRSVWMNKNGDEVTISAFPTSLEEKVMDDKSRINSLIQEIKKDPSRSAKTFSLTSFQGVKEILQKPELSLINYYIVNRDAFYLIQTAVAPKDEKSGTALLEELLEKGHWVGK